MGYKIQPTCFTTPLAGSGNFHSGKKMHTTQPQNAATQGPMIGAAPAMEI